MQLFGPFHGEAKKDAALVVEKRARMLVRSDFLALGLETWYADVCVRNEAPQPRFLPNSYGPAPFPAEWITKTNAIAREVGFTAAADRGAAGGELALGEFFALANQTPGLREIAAECVELPSVWSYLNVGKVGWGMPWARQPKVVTRFDAQRWEWAGGPIYRGAHVLVLNGKVAAQVALFATAPQPPVGMSAGIVGFTVETPKHPDRRVEMRVIGARRGG
jgi:hypothetical protein